MMKSYFLLLFLLVLLLPLAACGEDKIPTTPTPFDMGQSAEVLVNNAQATAVTLAELVAEPEEFDGQFLQLSGMYQHQPLLVCNGEAHPGPAGWLLVEEAPEETPKEEPEVAPEEEPTEPIAEGAKESEQISVAAGGFDSQLRSLIAEGTPLTVTGFWRFWEGPVGCGKQAVPRQLWYFRVTEIVQPAQLALIPITPQPNEGTAVSGSPITPTLPFPITPTLPIPITVTLPIPITPTQSLPDISTPTIFATPTLEQSLPPTLEPSPTLEDDKEEGTPDASATPDTPGGTPALTNTPPPGASLTPTPPPGTPTITPQPGTYTIAEVDPINPDEAMYGVEMMAAWQKQNWPLTLTDSQVITIGIAAEPTMNLAVVIYDEADNLLIEQDNAPAGQLEQISNLRVDPDTAYVIQVYETNGRAGAYFMTIVGDQTEVVLNSRGILTNGLTRQDTIAANHRHFWYFYGEAGDVIDITTTTDADKLMLISLYDMNADLVFDEDGFELEYIEEEIADIALPETGLYLIWLEEDAYEAAPYTITIQAN